MLRVAERQTPMRRSALINVDHHCQASLTPTANLWLQERRHMAVLQIAAWPDSVRPVSHAVAAMTGLASPGINQWVGNDNSSLLWVGPHRWLLIAEPMSDWESALRAAISPEMAAITEVGGGRTILRLRGEKAPELLRKGIALDLDESVFPTGHCASTLHHRIGVALLKIDNQPTFDLLVYRSFAAALWQSLTAGGIEYSIKIRSEIAA